MEKINIDYNKKYNNWLILEELESIKSQRYVKAKCDCWNIKNILLKNILLWKSKSCWHDKKNIWLRSKIHWLNWTKFYKKWRSAKERCYLKSNSQYNNYGWRWIIMEEKRKNNFIEFAKDEYLEYCKSVKKYWTVQIDRINNNWNYERWNIRWCSVSENWRNRRTNILLNYNWITKTMIEWCECFNLNYDNVRYHISKWKTLHNILTIYKLI